MLSGMGMIRLKSSDSTSTTLSGYQNSTTSEDIPDSDSVLSPLSPTIEVVSPFGAPHQGHILLSSSSSSSPLGKPYSGGGVATLSSPPRYCIPGTVAPGVTILTQGNSRCSPSNETHNNEDEELMTEDEDADPTEHRQLLQQQHMPTTPSSSSAVPRTRRRRPSNFLELPSIFEAISAGSTPKCLSPNDIQDMVPAYHRSRVFSLPCADELYKLRSFSTHRKGSSTKIINKGDSFISKRSRSSVSIASTTSSGHTGSWCTSPATPQPTSPINLSPPDAAATDGPADTTSITHSHRLCLGGSVEDLQGDDTVAEDFDWFAPHNLRHIRKGSSPGPRYDRKMYVEEFASRSGQAKQERSFSNCVQYRGRSPLEDPCLSTSFVSSQTSLEVPRYRVALLGHGGVGKTSLVQQLLTTEYINSYDASLDEEFGEKSVSVLLDDEETEVVFIDHPAHEISVENMLSTYDPHVCVVVYSVKDMESFRKAEDILHYLWQENANRDKAVILCANKVDLVRSRVIKTEGGRSLAISQESKYIETSCGIQHNVDELLVGIVKQVRLRLKARQKRIRKMSSSKTSLSLHAAKDLLSKMCHKDNKSSKSCENLHVL